MSSLQSDAPVHQLAYLTLTKHLGECRVVGLSNVLVTSCCPAAQMLPTLSEVEAFPFWKVSILRVTT
ncbi:hypothetical protein HYQ46_010018 [Verticillium longisporum]|nr:hypothetical protein HYQ46_010018 [Verticillium longisporum]